MKAKSPASGLDAGLFAQNVADTNGIVAVQNHMSFRIRIARNPENEQLKWLTSDTRASRIEGIKLFQ